MTIARSSFGVSAVCGALFLILALRLFSLEYPALTDPTEGRYALIGQNMYLLGDWVVPRLPINGGTEPYLGKPPFQFWAMASAFSVFGMDEWVARLPSFLAVIVTIAAIYFFCRSVLRRRIGVEASLILMSMAVIYFLSGSVTIDLTIAAVTASALTLFAARTTTAGISQRLYGYGFFFSLAIGFLAKGPVVLLFVGLPILAQMAVEASVDLIRDLPWAGGLTIFFGLVAPWFYLAERANPGFSHYFFVNENFLRFVAPQDYGDKYGSGHKHPIGTICFMFFVSGLPWTPFAIYRFLRERKLFSLSAMRQSLDSPDRWRVFMLVWALSPIIIFTFARRIHVGYALPGLPGAAVLTAWLIDRNASDYSLQLNNLISRWIGIGKLLIIISVVAMLAALFGSAPSEMAGFIIFALLCSLILLLPSATNIRRWREAVAYCSIVAVVGYSGALSVSADVIGDNSSAESILECITMRSMEKKPDIAVTGNSNFSTFYYSQAWRNELPQPVELRYYADLTKLKGSAAPAEILLRTEHSTIAMPAVPQTYKVISSKGHWTWLHRSDVKLKANSCSLD